MKRKLISLVLASNASMSLLLKIKELGRLFHLESSCLEQNTELYIAFERNSNAYYM